MTPSWLEVHASYIDSYHFTSDEQITFLLHPLMNAADLKDETPLTVEITMANEVSIPQ